MASTGGAAALFPAGLVRFGFEKKNRNKKNRNPNLTATLVAAPITALNILVKIITFSV